MLSIILLHGLLALGILTARRFIGRYAFPVAAIGPLATIGWAIWRGPGIVDGTPHLERLEWVPGLDLSVELMVDGYALLFVALIGVVGAAIFFYSGAYFRPGPRVPLFAASMVAFAGAMLGIVTSDHLLSVFIFWELTTITSYLLVGYDDRSAKARNAALHAAMITGAGGLAMLGGFVILADAGGSWLMSDLLTSPPAGAGLGWALILVGAASKSAQFPLHGWLPGAMAAPTPASAFLHSATMVKAGVFLVGRLSPAATAGTDWWWPVVFTMGVATMVVGGWQALRQTDLKLLLAYGTVSQLGFLFLLAGSGIPSLAYGAVALVLAHGLFKSSLFLAVGAIDSATGTRDIRHLDGIARSLPWVFAGTAAAAASMAAVPLTFGFVAKEAAFDGLVKEGTGLIAVVALASVLTVVYTGRFLLGAFGPATEEPTGIDPVGGWKVWVPFGLAGAGLVLGVAPNLVKPLVESAAVAVSGVADGKLVVWPGLVPALAWSLGSLTVGLLLVAAPRVVDAVVGAVRTVTARGPSTDGAFGAALTGLLKGADRITGVFQSGSLPVYLATIAIVVAVAGAVPLLGEIDGVEMPTLGATVEIPLALVVLVSAVGLLVTKRRFAAVVLLGGVGYGIAGLYAALGGPDLSLTQILVETLAIALFALVLRNLPANFDDVRVSFGKIVASLAVAGFVFVAGLVAVDSRTAPSVSEYYVAESLPSAAGKNVVNVILVDFRALDTLGEITVLAVATLGVTALVLPLLRKQEEDAK